MILKKRPFAAVAIHGLGDVVGAEINSDLVGRGEVAAGVALRSQQDDVEFWHEKKEQGDRGAEADAQGHGQDFLVTAKVDWQKGQPDHARRVHAEPDKLGLVEILRQIASLDCVHRTPAIKQSINQFTPKHEGIYLTINKKIVKSV